MTNQRLASLDALRGANLFLLVAVGPVLGSLCHAVPDGFMDWLFNPISNMLSHKVWEGFALWDIIMPLFMFMSAVSIPFSMAHYRRERSYGDFAWRLVRRVALLWILGMIVQGNLRELNPNRIYIYTNTLQSIAVGYAIASLFFMFTRFRTWIVAFILLLLAFWGAMEFISVDGFGGGQYSPTNNLAEWVDRTVLGRFRDAAVVNADGSVTFPSWYTYTWVLSSLTFGATSLAGLMAGYICKLSSLSAKQKVRWLLVIGVVMTAIGWLWHLEMPVIKHIWTSSFVLVVGGYSFILLSLFFWWYDERHHTSGLSFLQAYGFNSIVAYFLAETIGFQCIPQSLFYGLEQYMGDFYNTFIALCQAAIVFLILWLLKRENRFIRV